jgi:hypothetical protein
MNDDEDVVGLCTDCGTQQTDRHMFNSSFARDGKSAVCKYCSGVVTVCYRRDIADVLNQINIKRGLK